MRNNPKTKYFVLFVNDDELKVTEDRKLVREVIKEIVFALTSLIPLGKVTTYASIAKVLGINPRYVGKILSSNSNPIVIPCHRVIKSNLRIGGYTLLSKGSSVDFKKRLLLFEGVRIIERNNEIIIDKNHVIRLEDLFLN